MRKSIGYLKRGKGTSNVMWELEVLTKYGELQKLYGISNVDVDKGDERAYFYVKEEK